MVPDTSVNNPPVPSVCFGSVSESLGPNGTSTVPDASQALDLGYPAGASERPMVPGPSVGQGPQAGTESFHEDCVHVPPTLPEFYNQITDAGTFQG